MNNNGASSTKLDVQRNFLLIFLNGLEMFSDQHTEITLKNYLDILIELITYILHDLNML